MRVASPASKGNRSKLHAPLEGRVGEVGKSQLASGACGLGKQVQEEGAAVGDGGKLGHVADAFGKADHGGAASKQGRKSQGGLESPVVRVEREEDPGAASQRRCDPLDALRPKCSASRDIPGRKRKPVEDSLGHDDPLWRCVRACPSPSTGLGPGGAWKRGFALGFTARPLSQRTRPSATSGTTTMPANRSAPRSMNSPESRMRRSREAVLTQVTAAARVRVSSQDRAGPLRQARRHAMRGSQVLPGLRLSCPSRRTAPPLSEAPDRAVGMGQRPSDARPVPYG